MWALKQHWRRLRILWAVISSANCKPDRMQFQHKPFHRLKQDSQSHPSTPIRCPRYPHRVQCINRISNNRIVSSKQFHQSTIRRMVKISFHNRIEEVFSLSIMDLARCSHFLYNCFHRNHLDHSLLDRNRNHSIHRRTSRGSSLCSNLPQYRCVSS